MLSRTSGHSSFSWIRNSGSRNSIVLHTHTHTHTHRAKHTGKKTHSICSYAKLYIHVHTRINAEGRKKEASKVKQTTKQSNTVMYMYMLCHTKAHFSLPTRGDIPIMTEARADLTCWLASLASSWMQGNSCVRMASTRQSSVRASLNAEMERGKKEETASE